jgi:hypothetical protein
MSGGCGMSWMAGLLDVFQRGLADGDVHRATEDYLWRLESQLIYATARPIRVHSTYLVTDNRILWPQPDRGEDE